ncbi:hypothetical protein CCP1ISM_50027 [Azospirillaceae bacterium]
MNLEIRLINPKKYCEWCPMILSGEKVRCKKYGNILKMSFPYATSINHAHRLKKCIKENGL